MEQGKTAVVVGGASGIGEATSLLLAERGWRVIVCDINDEAAQGVAQRVMGHARRMDVCDAGNVEAVAAEIETTFGPVEGLAMCAAIFQSLKLAEETPIEEWDRIVQVSLRGTYLVDVAFGKRMAANGGGAVVNLSSFQSRRPAPIHAYCSAKAGVDALTAGMAGEYGLSGVRFNCVSPGTTLVKRVQERLATGQRYAAHPAKLTALGRLAEPVEVARAIAFLLSDEASAVTGIDLPVDAGMLVTPSWDMFGGIPAPRPRRVTAR